MSDEQCVICLEIFSENSKTIISQCCMLLKLHLDCYNLYKETSGNECIICERSKKEDEYPIQENDEEKSDDEDNDDSDKEDNDNSDEEDNDEDSDKEDSDKEESEEESEEDSEEEQE